MIIMGSKSRSARKILGDVTAAVSAHSAVPVVVVGGECDCSNSCGESCVHKSRFAPILNRHKEAMAC
jgi:hypothetical protein